MVLDLKHFTLNILIFEILFGLSSIIWFLEANVSISLAFFVNTNMNIFNFTKRFEDFCQVFFFPFFRKIFYIKVTSLVLINTFMKIYLIRINLLFLFFWKKLFHTRLPTCWILQSIFAKFIFFEMFYHRQRVLLLKLTSAATVRMSG